MCAHERLFRLALETLHTSVAACRCGWYLCYSGSRFIKGVAISTRQYVALRFVFVSSLSLQTLQTLWQSNTWFGQRGLTALPSARASDQPSPPANWSLTPHFITSRTSIFGTKRHLTVSTGLLLLLYSCIYLFIHFYFCAWIVRNNSAGDKHSYFHVNTIVLLLQDILAQLSVTVKYGLIVSTTVQFISNQYKLPSGL